MGDANLATDGGDGGVGGFGDLLRSHTGEVAHFHDTGFSFILEGESFEGFVEGEDVGTLVGGCGEIVPEGKGYTATASFGSSSAASVIHKNGTHYLGGETEELGAVLKFQVLLRGHLEVSLVDEGGGLDGFLPAATPEVSGRESAQLLIQEGREAVESCAIPFAPTDEQFRYLVLFHKFILQRGYRGLPKRIER